MRVVALLLADCFWAEPAVFIGLGPVKRAARAGHKAKCKRGQISFAVPACVSHLAWGSWD